MAMAKKKSRRDQGDYDIQVAIQLHARLNPLGLTENAVFPEDKNEWNYEPRTLVDQTLEIVDPTPNIYTLFSQFDARFFSNKLVSVEVKWSQRMTSCAGVCSFHPRNRDCVISLSAPLLKLRPRKDLVETLLHEMIHGYLFLTNNNRDRDGHGPEFRKFMDRINREAGTNITVYHSFHDEVRLYQQHWWRCDGPCQKEPPYFGMVRRAMNRAPGPADIWWSRHKERCSGRFIKVREPDKTKRSTKGRADENENKRPKAKPSGVESGKNVNLKDLRDWFPKKNERPGVSANQKDPKFPPIQTFTSSGSNDYDKKTKKPSTSGLVKLGTNTNNVHGWGTGGPGSSCPMYASTPVQNPKKGKDPRPLNFTGTLGGAGTGRSNILDKYSSSGASIRETKPRSSSPRPTSEHPPTKKPKLIETSKNNAPSSIPKNPEIRELCNCPVCDLPIGWDRLNDHLDVCLVDKGEAASDKKSSTIVVLDSPEKQGAANDKKSSTIVILDSPEKQRAVRGVGKSKRDSLTPSKGQTSLDSYLISPEKNADNLVSCPICDKTLVIDQLYDHLDRCSKDSPKNLDSPVNVGIQKDPNAKRKISPKNSATKAQTKLNESYVCLVCNVKISGDIALADHLDECVQAIFNDDTFDVGNDSITKMSTPKIDEPSNKFPCPVCMEFIRENLMNEHLDNCLK